MSKNVVKFVIIGIYSLAQFATGLLVYSPFSGPFTRSLCAAGVDDIHNGLMLKRMLQTQYFRLVVVEDAVTVEICGALKVPVSDIISQLLIST